MALRLQVRDSPGAPQQRFNLVQPVIPENPSTPRLKSPAESSTQAWTLCFTSAFCPGDWSVLSPVDTGMACAQGHPAASLGTERPPSCRQCRGPEGTFRFRQSLRGSRHPPFPPQTQGGPGAGRLAGSPNARRRPSRGQNPHRQAGWMGLPGRPRQAPRPEPQHLCRPGLCGEGSGARSLSRVRREPRALAWPPRSHGNLQRSGASSAVWETCQLGASPPSPGDAHHTPAGGWSGFQVGGRLLPAPAALHPNSALYDRKAEGSALHFLGDPGASLVAP